MDVRSWLEVCFDLVAHSSCVEGRESIQRSRSFYYLFSVIRVDHAFSVCGCGVVERYDSHWLRRCGMGLNSLGHIHILRERFWSRFSNGRGRELMDSVVLGVDPEFLEFVQD